MQVTAGIDLTGQRALVTGAIAMTVAVFGRHQVLPEQWPARRWRRSCVDRDGLVPVLADSDAGTSTTRSPRTSIDLTMFQSAKARAHCKHTFQPDLHRVHGDCAT
jgi:hypothetical protein